MLAAIAPNGSQGAGNSPVANDAPNPLVVAGIVLFVLLLAFFVFMQVYTSIWYGHLIRREGKEAADKDARKSWLHHFLVTGGAAPARATSATDTPAAVSPAAAAADFRVVPSAEVSAAAVRREAGKRRARQLRRIAASALLAVATSFCIALAADFQVPPRPTTEVVDAAGAMTDGARAALESELETFEAKTGKHVVVYIGQTTGGVPLETWTAETASTWKVGQKGKDDGAILFLFMKDRKVRIEVGYGLESTLTDALSKQIIDTVIVPRLQNGATDAAISEGAAAMLVTIDPSFDPTTKPDEATDASSSSGDDIGFWGYIVGGGFLLFGLYIAFAFFMSIVASIRRGYLIRREGKVAADKDMKRSWLNFWLLSSAASSGSSWGGGGFFSGGGFGGGGGFSGGSFGGGFGGGGASGGW